MSITLTNTIEYFGDKYYSIKPISKECKHLFDISKFGDKDIDKLIELNIEGKNFDELEDELYNICGGITIQRDNTFLVTPNCCGDLSDIYGWEEIKLNESKEWTKLWIGHPWIFYRKLNNEVQISDYYENDNPQIKFENIRFSMTIEQLEIELKRMRKVQEVFQEKLSKRLKMKGIKNHKQVAERMGCSYRLKE